MTTNMQDIIEQAFQTGVETGRAAIREEIAKLAQFNAAFNVASWGVDISDHNSFGIAKPGNSTRKRHTIKVSTKAANATKEPKAPVIASSVKKDKWPRTKGVKTAITSFISDSANGATVAEIVSSLGFKETSVRATLMGLKKSGIATQDSEKHWILATPDSNSEMPSQAMIS